MSRLSSFLVIAVCVAVALLSLPASSQEQTSRPPRARTSTPTLGERLGEFSRRVLSDDDVDRQPSTRGQRRGVDGSAPQRQPLPAEAAGADAKAVFEAQRMAAPASRPKSSRRTAQPGYTADGSVQDDDDRSSSAAESQPNQGEDLDDRRPLDDSDEDPADSDAAHRPGADVPRSGTPRTADQRAAGERPRATLRERISSARGLAPQPEKQKAEPPNRDEAGALPSAVGSPRPYQAPRTTTGSAGIDHSPRQPSSAPRPPVPRTARSEAAAPTPQPTVPTAPADTSPRTPPVRDDVMVVRESPVLHVETLGPRRIKVGAQALYRLNVENSGRAAARNVQISVRLPDWADIDELSPSDGTAQALASGGGCQWSIADLSPGGRAALALRITPRKPQPLDLAVEWSHSPVAAQAVVEVQEPKLELALNGPSDVLYGERQAYRLSVANPGTGDAEGVVVRLLPTDPSDHEIASHDLGTLKAGQSVVLDLELTARKPGSMVIDAEVIAEGGLKSRVTQEVLVRRAALEMAVAGPRFMYAGTLATYELTVVNSGTAPAREVAVQVDLPGGARCVAAGDGGNVEAGGARAAWTVARIEPGGARTMQIKVQLDAAGQIVPQARCTSAGDLTASARIETRVEAIADLVLSVVDPQGPVPAHENVLYEIRIKNRGTKRSDPVEVAAYFSEGIEPIGAEGAAAELGPGQVVFQTLPAIEPGREVVLRITASAQSSGNHVFRAEVRCGASNTTLAAEETTHFYDSQSPLDAGSQDPSARPKQVPADDGGPAEDGQPADGGEPPADADQDLSA